MNDINYISQYLRDIQFTEDEINELYTIIYDSVQQSKDIESQIAYSGNYKYINAFSLICEAFGSDWYWYVTFLGFGGIGFKYDKNLWIDKMLKSYFDVLNVHFDLPSKADYLPILQARLQPDYVDSAATGYLYNTFGPAGQNKIVCDFIMLFKNSNTTTNLATRTITKAGATLRWNYGNNIYTQNNLPAQTTSGFITVSSLDGFSGLTLFNISTNTFSSNLTNYIIAGNLTNLSINSNSLTGNPVNLIVPSSTTVFLMYSNQLTGDAPNITPHLINALTYRLESNNLTSASSLTTFRNAMAIFNISNNYLPTSKVDELLHNINLYYAGNTPTANCIFTMNGANMGIPTGGASNTDLLGILASYTAAGNVATILIRTS
jgi:hypothetical protein